MKININVDKLKKLITEDVSDMTGSACSLDSKFCIGKHKNVQIQIVVTKERDDFLPVDKRLTCLEIKQ